MTDYADLVKRLEDGDFEFCGEAINAIKAQAARIAELKRWNQQMVEKAASDGKLDGYRALGQRVAKAETRAEAAEARVAELERDGQRDIELLAKEHVRATAAEAEVARLRADLEEEYSQPAATLVTEAQMHQITVDGSNADLVSRLATALMAADKAARRYQKRFRKKAAENANLRAERDEALATSDHWRNQVNVAAAQRDEAVEVVRRVIAWSRLPCPCEGEQPDPCPVCRATVAEGVCKPGVRLPDALALDAQSVLAKHSTGEKNNG